MLKNKKVMAIIIVIVVIFLIYWFFIRKTKEGISKVAELRQNAQRGKQQEAIDAVARAQKLIAEVTACMPAPNERRIPTPECTAKIEELKGFGYQVTKDIEGKATVTKL